MPADGTQIKQDINNDLGNKGYRGVRTFMIIATLLKVVDWVTSAVNNNLSTWLKQSDNSPGGANADAVFRTGNTEFRGGMVAKGQTPTNTALGAVPFNSQYPLQIQGINGGPAFMEFHLPGSRIDQIGVDTDGRLKFHPWNTTAAYAFLIDTFTAAFALNSTLANRKVVLYLVSDNDHQFYGLGINDNVFRLQLPSTGAGFVFYAGTSAATSQELMRLTGTGKLGIGRPNPTRPLEVGATNPADGILVELINLQGGGTGTGSFVRVSQTDAGFWDLGVTKDNFFLIRGWNGAGALVERARFVPAGRMLIGQTTDTGVDLLQVGGSISGKFNTASANPGSGDIPAGYFRLQKNTSNGELRLWANDGGTMKSVLLS